MNCFSQWKKSGIALLLSLVMSLGLLAGCSSDTNPTETTPSQNSSISTTTQEDQATSSETMDESESTASPSQSDISSSVTEPESINYSLSDIPAFSGEPYIVLNGNVPYFTENDFTTTSFETYSNLDSLGRCGVAYANVGQDLMPTEKRGSIGQVKPSGWHTVKYDIVDGKYLYNRCHLIGYQLTAENANEKNLITGTRYLNVTGMLPFENMVVDYVKETGNHVLYRVTPVFDGDNLVASGVIMEAESVEDNGDDILFCVYCYNAQPGVSIDYKTGDSQLNDSGAANTTTAPTQSQATVTPTPQASTASQSQEQAYVLNTNTHKFHKPGCSSVAQIKDENRQDYTGIREDVIAMGYDPCKKCNP